MDEAKQATHMTMVNTEPYTVSARCLNKHSSYQASKCPALLSASHTFIHEIPHNT